MALPDWATQTEDDMKFSARGTLVSGGVLYMMATIFQMVGSLGSVLILSRLVTLDDFGVYGMVLPLITVLLMCVDGGANYFTIRRPKVDHAALSFAFWYCIAVGVGLLVLTWASAPLLAWLFDEPRLVEVTLVMGFVLLFGSAGSQHLALTIRCFRNDLRAYASMGAVAGSIVIGVTVAWFGGGYWAFVSLILSRGILNCAILMALTGWRPDRPRFDRDILSGIRRLGHTEMMSRIVFNGVRASDRVLVGVLFNTVTAGIYSVAYMVTMMPMLQLTAPLLALFVPYLAEEQHNRTRLFATVRRLISALVYMLIPTTLLAALFAHDILTFVLGADKAAAATIFPMLAVAASMSVMIGFVAMPFQSIDRPDIERRDNLRMAGLFVVILALAIPLQDPAAIAWAVLIGNMLALIVRYGILCRHFEQGLMAEVRHFAPLILISVAVPLAVLGATYLLGEGFTGQSVFLRVPMVIGMFLPLYGVVGWVLFRDDITHIITHRRQGRPAVSQAAE